VGVRWRPPLSVAIVTQFVIRSLASRSERLLSLAAFRFGHALHSGVE
jgi:hypothetical protein